MKKSWVIAILLALVLVLPAATLSACGDTDADVASENLSKAAEQFEVDRRVVFFNGITDKYLLVIEGRCSIEEDGGWQLEVTCLVDDKAEGDRRFKKHFLGLSDNVSYFVEQTEAIGVSTTHYRVIFKPEVLVPDFDRP